MFRIGLGVGRPLPSFGAFDSDAQAFITAAGITDATQQAAINTLVVDLKGYGIWSKMKAVYPFVGGTASTHKYNLVNPVDSDAAFRLVFNGGWTHSSTGATPNGTNGYADTKLNPNTVFGSNFAHQSFYSRTNNTTGTIIQGVFLTNRFDMGYDSGNTVPFVAIGSNSSTVSTDNSSLGFVLSYRTGSTTGKMLRNNSLKVTDTQTFSAYPNANYWLGARNPSLFSKPFEYALASIGDGLTDTEASNLYTAVQAFQTSLSRQV